MWPRGDMKIQIPHKLGLTRLIPLRLFNGGLTGVLRISRIEPHLMIMTHPRGQVSMATPITPAPSMMVVF